VRLASYDDGGCYFGQFELLARRKEVAGELRQQVYTRRILGKRLYGVSDFVGFYVTRATYSTHHCGAEPRPNL
jgi:hypothetical protein